jgi:hypothetical protein
MNLTNLAESFRYTSPAFITADTFIPGSTLDLCSTALGKCTVLWRELLSPGPDTLQHYPELTFQIRNPDNSRGNHFLLLSIGQ